MPSFQAAWLSQKRSRAEPAGTASLDGTMAGLSPAKPEKRKSRKARASAPAAPWKKVLIDTWNDAGDDNLSLVSAGVAFYIFLALVPLLTAVVMPGAVGEIVADQLRGMTQVSGAKTGLALVIALGIALYGASKAASAIMTALNIVYEKEECRSWLGQLLVAFAMTLGAVLALVVALATLAALAFLETLLPGLGGATEFLLRALFLLGAGAIVMLLVALVYRYVPCRIESKWRWITPGSVIATLVWMAATAGFGAYVANFGAYNVTYGSLGAVIVFLTWLYLSAYILLLGAELNSILDVETGPRKARRKAA